MKRTLYPALLAALALTACGDDPVVPGANASDNNGATNNGATNNGATNNGASNNGASNNGASNNGRITNNGATNNGEVNNGAPMGTCQTDADCVDGLDCTTDTCGDDGFCAWAIQPGKCLIHNVCQAPGAVAAENPCLTCAPAEDARAWTARGDGAPCDDGDACTIDTTCQAAACGGGVGLSCEDGNGCTDNLCDPTRGCTFPAKADGDACDDGDACTTGDACVAGQCEAADVDCADLNVCTDDSCDPDTGACVHAPNTAACDDGDACTSGESCAEGVCGGGTTSNCDDGNICTIDGCEADAGCWHLPTQNPCCNGQTSICDDGNPCTDDNCDPETGGCIRDNNAAQCSDGSQCTSGDVCTEGRCVGVPIVCNDHNGCTSDSCNDASGCVATALSGEVCDDGVACSSADRCVAGQCVGDTSTCVCEPTFSPAASRLNSVNLGATGTPGESLDLDNNPATCSPGGTCSDGIDNALGLLAGIVNPALDPAVADGSLTLLVELRDFQLNPFIMAVYDGELAPNNPMCDLQTASCDYLVGASLLDPATCEPVVALPANLSGNRISAGGPGTRFPFEVPIGTGTLSLVLYNVRFEGTVTLAGDRVTALDGVLGGGVRRTELIAALYAVPADVLPFPPDTVASLLNFLIVDDLDTDGDNVPDAASIGIKLRGIGATLVGVAR